MAKSKYDRNIDKGAAQQRNAGQGMKRGCNKPGMPAEEPMGTGQQGGGGAKNQGGSAKPNRESSWRPKSDSDEKD